MKSTLSVIVFLLVWITASGQSTRSVATLRSLSAGHTSDIREIPLAEVQPFLAWSAVWAGDAPGLWVRFSADGREWSEWAFAAPEIHAAELPGQTVGQLKFEDAGVRFFQVKAEEDLDAIHFHFFNPGPEPPASKGFDEASAACPCPLPTYQRRADWCPAGNCPPSANPSYTVVTHLIVHHSATSNTTSNWAAVVRSFWDFHVNTNGWADIGYNWLIDPNGVLYQGRGDNVLGAHFCGTNGQTMGVCVIGDFTTATPSAAALDQLRSLLAWKACVINADPLSMMLHVNSGFNLFHISGHRDGCNTSCPGDMFYPMLPTVRQNVANYITNVCSVSDAEEPGASVDALRIFPNPAGDLLAIELPEGKGGTLEIVQAASGLPVHREWRRETGLYTLSIASLPPGVYHIRLRSTEGFEQRAVFIKQ